MSLADEIGCLNGQSKHEHVQERTDSASRVEWVRHKPSSGVNTGSCIDLENRPEIQRCLAHFSALQDAGVLPDTCLAALCRAHLHQPPPPPPLGGGAERVGSSLLACLSCASENPVKHLCISGRFSRSLHGPVKFCLNYMSRWKAACQPAAASARASEASALLKPATCSASSFRHLHNIAPAHSARGIKGHG